MVKTNLFKQLVANNLTLESAPFPSELGMEAFLMDNPEVLAFGDEEPGYPNVIDCEISLDNCRESAKNTDGRGRLDILVQYGPKKFGILELKKSEVGKNALRQVCDYLVKRTEHFTRVTPPHAKGGPNASEMKIVKKLALLLLLTAGKTVNAQDVALKTNLLYTTPQKLSLSEMMRYAQTLEPGSEAYNDVFETAVRIYPNSETANLNAANAAMQRGDLHMAERYLAKAGTGSEAVYARGVLAALRGDYDRAMELIGTSGIADKEGILKHIEEVKKYR